MFTGSCARESRYGLRNLEASAFLMVERSEQESKCIPVIEYLCSFPRSIHRNPAEFTLFALDLKEYIDETSLNARIDAIALIVEVVHYRTLRNRGCSIEPSGTCQEKKRKTILNLPLEL